MQYLNCPRCGLAIQVRGHGFTHSECPRCRVRADVAMPMYTTRDAPSPSPVRGTSPTRP